MIVEGGIAAADRFQAIVEVEHHLVERQLVDQHRARADIGEVLLPPAPVLAQLEHAAQMLVRHQDGGLDPRLLDALDAAGIGHVGRVVHLELRAVVEIDVIDDARRRGDEVEVELALEPLGDDLQVQQPQEAAAEAEAKRRRAFRLVA